MLSLSPAEVRLFKKYKTPIHIQDFLDTFPINHEKKGGTYWSPRRVLQENKMHCLEGALVAALIFWLQGKPALLMDLKTNGKDADHVVTLYKQHGYWGALSKTNHASLRFRDPVYKTLRELALSYFHEYFLDKNGQKVLRSFSEPFNVRKLGTQWITAEDDLQYIAEAIDTSAHHQLVPKKNLRYIRKADIMERRAGKIIEWRKNDPRT
jgi:hypothetical protein